MKNQIKHLIIALAILPTLNLQLATAQAQGTAFTYQGRLNSGGTPASGSYDLTFSLFNTNASGVAIAGPVTNSATAVSNGLFTTTIDFGAGVFTGASNWLEIAVSAAGSNNFTTLAPRQQITPTPYAIFANAASNLSGTVSLSQLPGAVLTNNNAANVTLSGAFTGNGGGLTNLNASQLTSGTIPLAQLSGITSTQLDATTWQLATNLNGGNSALASNVVSGINITNAFITNSIFAGDGGGLTSLNATQLVGTIANANLPASPNFPGTVTANNITVTNLTIAANAFTASNLTVNGNLSLSPNTPGAGLIYSGTNLLFAHYAGNVLAGFYAGSANITSTLGNNSGGDNLALGDYALTADTQGYYNTAVGYYSMNGNSSGSQNTGIGAGALQNNTSGGQNTAVGFQALFTDSTGQNTAVGYQALFSVGSASQNTAVGFQALLSTYNGNNTALGYEALTADTSGAQNTAVGSQSMLANVNGSGDTALGFASLYRMTGGQGNTALGQSAMFNDTTGSYCVAVGEYALSANTTGFNNTAIGDSALSGDNGGGFNTVIGAGAMTGGSSANNNTAIGYQTLRNSTGDGNIALGFQAGLQLNSGGNNIYIGNQGVSSENNTIRLGDPSVHTATYIAGVIYGNGAGLSNVVASSFTGSVSASQLNGTVVSAQIGGTYGNTVNFTSGGNTFNGAFSGNGAGLTNVSVSASSLPVGILTNNSSGVVLSGTFSGNGAGLTNLNVSGIATTNFWQLGGNNVASGQFLGSTNNQPLELWVNGSRAFRLDPSTNSEGNTPNVIGGSPANNDYISGDPVLGTVVGATIAGGGLTNSANTVQSDFGVVGGGYGNTALGYVSTIAGGVSNQCGTFYYYTFGPTIVIGSFSTIGGGTYNFDNDDYATIGGGYDNYADYTGTVGGGANNWAEDYAMVGGGYNNVADDSFGTIGGGVQNIAYYAGTVGGGTTNSAYGSYATVGGGDFNNAGGNNGYGVYATVGGGYNNGAVGPSATVGGGANNFAAGQYATVAGGYGDNASGDYSFAGGRQAYAPYPGDFVWSDDSGGLFESTVFAATATNQFAVRATGGVVFYTSGTAGTQLAPGSGSWSMFSDRNAKENFQPVDAQTVLTAVAAMPMTTWNYKTQAKTIRHVGPMAQDFAAAFHVGENDTTISTVDEGGVALAAIQGLNQKLNEKDGEIQTLKQQNDSLAERLNELEATVKSLAEKK